MPRIAEPPKYRDIKKDKWILYRNQLKSDVTKYLGSKLAKKLNVSHIKVPWLKMKAEDIINWPQEVRFVPIRKMNIIEAKKLHKLAKENLLDFTPEFISRFKPSRVTRDQLRLDITQYLEDKLAKKLNVYSIPIPWSKMKAEDIINWPSSVTFKRFHQMNMNDLKRFHKLVKEDLLDFTPEFLFAQAKKRNKLF
jgi:DNA-binding NtrC family response regulator